MAVKISKRNRDIITCFKTCFDPSALFTLCSQIFCKQSCNLRKKYQNLCAQLQLNKGRIIQSQKQQHFLETKINMLVACKREGHSILQKFEVNQLITILKLLSEWKKSISLCFSFLKEAAQIVCKQLQNPIISHITKYYEIVSSVLSDILFRKNTETSQQKDNFEYREKDFCEFFNSAGQLLKGQKSNNEGTKYYLFKDMLRMDEGFTYKANSITLYRKDKKSAVLVSTAKKLQKKEIKSEYASKNQIVSRKIKDLISQDQNMTKITLFIKQPEEKEMFYKIGLQEKPQSKIEINKPQTEIYQRREAKFVVRHRSTIQSQLNITSIYPKSSFKSSNRLEETNNFTTNPYQTSSQITYSSNSKTAVKSNKTQGKDSIARNRVSKNAFRKSLVEKLQSKKVSQNKGSTNFMSNQELQKINESKQNFSQSQRSQQQFNQITQQNIQNDFPAIEQKVQNKEDIVDDFCSSKSFKNQKYKRRFGSTKNTTNFLSSLDRIESFLSGDSKKEIKKVKTQTRPSFFRTSGMNFVENESRSIKGLQRKMSRYPKKLIQKNTKNENILNDSGQQQKKAEKIVRRFHTEADQNVYKMDMVDIKEYYQMLTQIKANQQKSYQNHPEYYHEIFKRKYSNNQNIFDYDSKNRAKPFKIKLEIENSDHIVNRPNNKKDIFLFDLMNETIKNSQSLSLGQYGLSEIF